MGRQNFMVTLFSEIAFEHFQMLKENYQQLESFDKMCGEVINLQHEIRSNYITTITFAAMSMEAFLNDYAAKNLGDDFFYENFENLRPFAKLQLISKMMFNKTIDKGGIVYSSMNQLFKERNKLVHSKSREFRGMSKEEYQEYQQLLNTDDNFSDWLFEESQKIEMDDEKCMVDKACAALRSLKEVASFIDENDNHAYSSIKLLCSGWYVGSSSEKYKRIKSAQDFLGIKPLIYDDEE